MRGRAFERVLLRGARHHAIAQETVHARGTNISQARSFNIPAQPLTGALNQFGRQSGLQVAFPAETSQGVRSSAVVGSFTPQQALAQLLRGTGIGYRITPNSTAIVGGQQAAGATIAPDGSVLLDTITVTDRINAAHGSGFQGTPDWVYEAPESVSVISRQAILNNPSRNARDLLDSVPGVVVNRSEGQNPGMSINIRGLQDQNRVVTMIDGARQNFQRAGHGATQRTYVDTNLVRAIDINKSSASGVGGAGALGGSVNFRTIEADDLIRPGKSWGSEFNLGTGTNAYDFNGSGAVAIRLSDRLSILGGISHLNMGAYEIGKNGEIKLADVNNDDGAAVFTGQKSLATLFKAEAKLTDDMEFTFGWLRNEIESSQGGFVYGDLDEDTERTVNNTVTANLAWDPASELIDLKARLWLNHLKNEEQRGDTRSDVLVPVDYGLVTYGGSLENTSRFYTSLGELSLNYGVEAFLDDGETSTESMIEDGIDYSYGYRGTNPTGRRDVVSGFTNATLQHDDWLTLSAGLRYDYFGLNGSTVVHGKTVTDIPWECLRWVYLPGQAICAQWIRGGQETTYPRYDVDADLSGGAFLPTAMIAVQATDWLQPFVRYSRSYRPPTIMEALFSGGHPNLPPIENAPNPWLKPEKGETWEVGVNLSKDGVFAADDSLRVKAVAFHRNIEDYIGFGKIHRSETGMDHWSYVNLDGTTVMRGLELEANYDAGRFYIGGTFTLLDADWADSYSYGGTTQTSNPAVLFTPPERTFALDGGVRLFDEKLTLGGRITYADASAPAYGQLSGNYVTEDYTLFDLYGSYRFNDNATLRAAVTNLTDVAYVPALGAQTLPGPGRTATLSLNFRF